MPPEAGVFSAVVFVVMISTGFLLVLIIIFVMRYFARESETGASAYMPLETEEELSSREASMMYHHLPTTVMFQNLTYTIPTSPSSADRYANPEFNVKFILDGILGCVRPGQVMAIMGGSGAGKTVYF